MDLTRRVFLAQAALAQAAPRNILLIAVDDLNTDLGCYGHPLVQTPNIDRLARRGVRFTRAYCNYPVCNPSRTSLLSGRYPEQAGVLDNRTAPHEKLAGVQFLPEYLRSRGYFTASVGKIYHDGMDSPADWDVQLNPRGSADVGKGEGRNLTGGKFPYFHWTASEAPDDEHPDGQIAAEAVKLLEQKRAKPFFLAVGFRKPHDRYIAPKKYFDLYPPDRIPAAVGPADDPNDIPAMAYPQRDLKLGVAEAKEFRRAYWSCISFMDAQVGKVLDALDRSGQGGSTLVLFFSDHGLHLGEHDWWNKVALWERTTRVPFIAAGPMVRDPGRACANLVELLDIYPTFTSYAGLPAAPGQMGRSVLPALSDPRAVWERAAYTMVLRGGGKKGRALRTSRFRYVEWDGGQGGVELYDHDSDPNEFRNLADDAAYGAHREGLQKMLRSRP
ncbi:MAG: sulfatase [Acidobacteria bacterium]|nr:sulfatase [Acidobacteriota bacterium]